MKIVQSLWSKPFLKNTSLTDADRNNGGWKMIKHYYMSWALSCLQLRKFYNHVELVTDKQGYDLLINKLNLPYTETKVILDDLNDYHTDLWALGKIYAYRIQNTSFIHVDGDVYIWRQFDHNFESKGLVAQNLEANFKYYKIAFDSVKAHFEYIPSVLLKSKDINGKIIGANAGVIGGSNIEFFNHFSNVAKDFIDRNQKSMESIDIGSFNVIFEQFLFHALAEQKGIKVQYLYSDIDENYSGLCDFIDVPENSKFVHTIGAYKKNEYICSILEYRLRKDHPNYYYKILNLLRTYQI